METKLASDEFATERGSRTPPESASWWYRPAGGREVLLVATPLVLATLSWTVMTLIDRLFLAWYSPETVAAATPAGLLMFVIMCFPFGIASYANTFVAQYHGAGQFNRIGALVWQALWVGIVTTPLFCLAIPWAPTIFAWTRHPSGMLQAEVAYFQTLAFGAGGVICSAALSSFFGGRGETRVLMYVDLAAALINVVLDYLWIFGHAGFPEGGIVGAAWATNVANWSRCAFYLVLMLRPVYRTTYGTLAEIGVSWPLMRRLAYFGAPEGLRLLVDVSAYTGFLILVGRLGETAAVASSIAFSLNNFVYIPILGLGAAVSTLVGQRLGANQPQLAERATHTALIMALGFCSGVGILFWFWPGMFLRPFGLREGPGALEQFQTSARLLRFVAAYCLLDACQLVYQGAVRGAGDSRFILGMTLVMSSIPLTVTWIGLRYWNWELMACWTVLTLWVSAFGVAYGWRFYQGAWKNMRVIGPSGRDAPG